MGYFFSPYQILEMTMQFEKEGMVFYNYLANRSNNKTVKNIFLFLSEQEQEHCKGFSKIASQTKKDNPQHEYSIDVAKLLQQSIDNLKGLAFNKNISGNDSIDIEKCLDIAMHTEEQSVNVYNELLKSFTDRFHNVLQEIIKEEKKHLETLLNIRNKLHS